ncbi:MAG: nucleotidyl transferase AbiEii/AbiGii toxin family protein [Acidobacteria bacterium]|nr:nucleotidyl transferase AbiEii/AbiGii toxin family protein [Acidobacteriota bacterium]
MPTSDDARDRLAVGYALDYLWGESMGLPDGDSKEKPLRLIAEILEREHVPYALIGGVAVQVHKEEPRSTLDIDLAAPRYADVPRAALLDAGFEHTGRRDHSDNWRAPGPGTLKLRTAIQFSAEDVGITEAVAHAGIVDLDGGLRLRVATVADLIALKLAAAEEPKRRPSKREHDVADVLALIEEHPELKSPELMTRVQSVRTRLLAADLDLNVKTSEPEE